MSRRTYAESERRPEVAEPGPQETASPLRVRARLEVGRVDDPAEVEADAMAARVMALLARGRAASPTPPAPLAPGTLTEPDNNGGDGIDAAGPFAEPLADPASDTASRRAQAQAQPQPRTRISRRAGDDGLGGHEVAPDLEGRIRAAGSGRPLPGGVRQAMEGAFGLDLGAVRTHVDSDEAVQLQAEAFTVGNHIHFAPGRFDPNGDAGRELLAHELTHVAQQDPAAQRRIRRRLWTQDTFDTDTSEGMFTARSTAQVEIRKLIAEYHTTFPGDIAADGIPRALALISQMREMTNAWKAAHTTKDGSENADRAKRMDGMKRFLANLADEEAVLRQRFAAAKQAADPTADPAALGNALDLAVNDATTEADRAKTKKVTDHYEGSATSTFRHFGSLIDLAAPNTGDETKIELEAVVPIEPTLTVRLGLHFVTEVERSEAGVKLKTQLGVVVKGNIANVVEIAGELGGFYQVQAKTGADAAELISYELYRRAKESKVFPSGAASYMWGGRSSAVGAEKADEWSRELETRLFGTLAGVPKLSDYGGDWARFAAARDAWMASHEDELDDLLEVYVESGAYTAARAKASLAGLVELQGSVTGSLGRRIDFLSLMNRKGGAGQANLASDSMFNAGGAQKNVGRTVGGFVVEVKAAAGPLEGSGKYTAKWLSDGKRETKGEEASVSYQWELEVEGVGKMPFTELLGGGAGGLVAGLGGALAQAVRRAAAEEEATAGQAAGTAVGVGENTALALTHLAKVPRDTWKPSLDLEPEAADGTVKPTGNVGIKVKLTAEPDGVEITISLVKESGIEIAGFFKAALEKSQRIIGLKVDSSGARPI